MGLIAFAAGLRADWVAFNDHAPGTGTSPNATTNNIRLGTSAHLKNVVSGTNLNATLTLAKSGAGISYTTSGAAPANGTPLFGAFNNFVSFAAGTDSNVEITNSTVTYVFVGLSAFKRYSFKGGANVGLAASVGSNRWTRVEITGAASFSNAHSALVLTSTDVPANLAASQVAVNFAVNTASGDLVDWENIDPGPDGAFSIVCSQYQGTVPGGSANGTNGYAITGIRLEELRGGPPLIVTQPGDTNISAGQSATFTVVATGTVPLSYQWYRNGSAIFGATSSSYTTPSVVTADNASKFSVVIMNSLGTNTSRSANLGVTALPFDITDVTNTVWKYDQSGGNLGDTWNDVAFNDSAWASGKGVFAFETDNNTVLPLINTFLSLSNAAGAPIITYYFRTHVNIAEPTFLNITASNLVDDGAVIYVNGQEVRRDNLPPSPNVIRYDTTANSVVEAAWTGYSIASSFFVPGDNVIAVEVHNVSPTSASSPDIVFGMRLIGTEITPAPVVVRGNPTDLTVTEGAAARFTVRFSGSQAKFQWYYWSNDIPYAVPGATRSTLTISNAFFDDTGLYSVVITNSLSIAQSAAAFLTVVADVVGPVLLSADGTTTPTNVTATFSEPIATTDATNAANYAVTNVTTHTSLPVIKAVLASNRTNVTLTTSGPRIDGVNYLLIVNNLRDISPRANLIDTNSTVPISALTTLVGMEQVGWAYFQPFPGVDNPNPGANWNQLNFQLPNTWGTDAAGLFVYDPGGSNPLPAAKNTDLSIGTAYFRYVFNFNSSPAGIKLRFRHIVDDGIVAYLNGTEFLRFNMPAGPVTTNTLALSEIGSISSVGPIEIPAVNLRGGSNVLAVELHGIAANRDSDLVFGAELSATIQSYPTGAVVITRQPKDFTIVENQPMSLEFVGLAATSFQWKTNGTPIPGATEPRFQKDFVPLSWNGKIFSVTASNSTSSATTSGARLTVTPDGTAPSLVAAYGIDQTSILISFSEPVREASATNRLNYAIQNASGPDAVVLGGVVTDATNVLLTLQPLVPGTYTVVVSNVQDSAVSPNTICDGASASVAFFLQIPIDDTWLYNINGTDLGTSWRNIGFNDTTEDWSSGQGLIADETAVLPATINTPISRLANDQYHYTFYFRYHFTSPIAMNKVPVVFRHIIDDGVLMYINGQQFHSFNMTNNAATVNYNSQASINVGDAIYNGPYPVTWTNIVAGDNVIAAEVHQNGTNSSDVTFGAEFTIGSTSTNQSPCDDNPPLSITRQGTNVLVLWQGNGFRLEKRPDLAPSTLWIPTTNQSPVIVPQPQTKYFYQLHK